MAQCSYGVLCIHDTGFPEWDDTYTKSGNYNGNNYYFGLTNGYVIFYSTAGYWCLSEYIDGECFLSGKSPCTSDCPDFCDDYYSRGICPPPDPGPTDPCDIFNFNAIFDCDVTPTPTVTPSITPTISVTPTITSTQVCPLGVDAILQFTTPTPTGTPAVTPTSQSIIVRDCGFLGDVTFTTINSTVDCPFSLEFQDCYNGLKYYTTASITRPEGGNLESFMIYQASVDGLRRCISYVGVNMDIIGSNTISLLSNLIGYSNLGECTYCLEVLTPTPTVTPSITPTITVSSSSNKPAPPPASNTPTPTKSRLVYYYGYEKCGTNVVVWQPTRALSNQIIGQTFRTGPNGFSPNSCFRLAYISQYIINSPTVQNLVYNTNAFTSILLNIYNNCNDCISQSNSVVPTQATLTPTPTKTITPTPTKKATGGSSLGPLKPHQVRLLNNGCNVCNGGGNVITIYSQCDFFVQGCSVYYESQGTSPIPANNYVKSNTAGGPVWLIGNGGVLLNFSCAGC
jgi:hypothetical protein